MTSGRFRIVFWLNEREHERTGSTARSLAHLVALGHFVPDGFAASADAYRTHFWRSGAKNLAASGLSEETNAEIRRMILREPLAPDVADAVSTAYTKLCPSNEPVTVRLSVLQDERAGGVYEAAVTASGVEAVLGAIKKVWSSMWTDEAVAYREQMDVTGEPLAGVVIQKAVTAAASGTVTTVDPATGDPRRVIVQAASSGTGNTDSYTVELFGHTICEKRCGPEEALSEPMVLELAELGLIIDDQLQSRIKVDWVFDGERFWVSNVSPIVNVPLCFPTTWLSPSEERLTWKNASGRTISHFARSLPIYTRRRTPTSMAIARKSILRRCQNGCAFTCERWPWSLDNLCSLPWRSRVFIRWREVRGAVRLLDVWEKEVRPYIRAGAVRLIKAGYANHSLPRLVRELRRAIDLHDLMLEWFDALWYPSLRTSQIVEEMLVKFGVDEAVCSKILGAVQDPAVTRDAKLLELAAEARGLDPEAVKEQVEAVETRIDLFVRTYGYSYGDAREMCDPASWRSWIEASAPLLSLVNLIGSQTARNPGAAAKSSSQDAAAALGQVCSRLGLRRRRRLRKMVKLARRWIPVMSERELALAQVGCALRLAALDLGRRLVELGVISEPNDVFLFTRQELLRFPKKLSYARLIELRKLAIKRKHELWLDSRLDAPESLAAFSESLSGAKEVRDEPEIAGDPCSPGLVVGLARVAGSIEDAGLLKTGEILVAQDTSLAWTPYLSIAAALVSEQGSRLSPESALAREYSIPCVTGVRGATSIIRTGDLIAVDGNLGLVQRRHLASETAKKLEREI